MNQKQSWEETLEKLLSEYDDWYLVESNTKELKARHEARKNYIETIFKQAIQTREREIYNEIFALENDAEPVYSASGCDYDEHINKNQVLSIINNKSLPLIHKRV